MSALGAVGVIYYNGKQARTRALIDLIIQQKTDHTLLAATKKVYQLAQTGQNHLTDYLKDKDSEEFKAILTVLNNQEFIAVGIREKAFSESIYKEMQCSNVLKIWRATKGFATELRTRESKNTLFQDFECLAERWEKTPIKHIRAK